MKMQLCSGCGCELSFKELHSTNPLCFVCDRNKQDRAEQRREREWNYPREGDTDGL